MEVGKNIQPRPFLRGCRIWIGRILIGLAALIFIILCATLIAGAKAKSDLKAKYPPPGRMVDVGGYRLHILCEGTGSPTVVMESGSGRASLDWELVRPEIIKTTRTCVYDRAGLGWSDLSSKPRTAENIVEELHTVLTNAGIAGPYVLVGHSIGGAYVRLYAHHFPDDVVGMVLVDSSHEDQLARYPPEMASYLTQYNQVYETQMDFIKSLAEMGIVALDPTMMAESDKLPVTARETYEALYANSKVFTALIAEQKMVESNLAQVGAAQITSLGDIPLIVLTRGRSDDLIGSGLSPEVIQQYDQVWRQLQKELTGLSPQGRQIIASQSGHFIQLDQPQLVIDAIDQVIADVRK
jgi:pimeloyl-ACP methyl ester carboxylesterase